MGTRNLTIVQANGDYKVAQYCQWDGYPGGQGSTVLSFLRSLKSKKAWAQFRKNVLALKPLTPEEVSARWKEVTGNDTGWATMEESDRFKAKYEHLQRDCGAKVLELIHTGKVNEVSLDINFTKDSLFCEWAYVIDLDKQTLEVYKGFNTKPLKPKERFYFDGYAGEKTHDERDKKFKPTGKKYGYYPVRHLKTYSLAKLPTLNVFLNECDPKNNE